MITAPALTGAALGLALVLGMAGQRPPGPADRPGLAVSARPAEHSRLLSTRPTHTPFPTLEQMLQPVLGDLVRAFERLGSPAAAVQRRLARAGSSATVEHFRVDR